MYRRFIESRFLLATVIASKNLSIYRIRNYTVFTCLNETEYSSSLSSFLLIGVNPRHRRFLLSFQVERKRPHPLPELTSLFHSTRKP